MLMGGLCAPYNTTIMVRVVINIDFDPNHTEHDSNQTVFVGHDLDGYVANIEVLLGEFVCKK